MATKFSTADALFSAAQSESDGAARMDLFRENLQLLPDPLLAGVAGQAQELANLGEIARALQANCLILEAAAAVVESGRLSALGIVIVASGQAAELAAAAGDLDRARSVLAEARRVARSARSAHAELLILHNLVAVATAYEPQDLRSANEYALEAARLLSMPASPLRDGDLPPPSTDTFANIFATLGAQSFEAGDYELSARLTRAWRMAAPDDLNAARELALVSMHLGQYAEAEGLWRLLLSTAPDETLLLINLAASLAGQSRLTEALPLVDRAIELAPDDLPFRRRRVDLRRATGDIDGAIADLDHMIALADAQPLSREVLDSALLDRAALYENKGDLPRALADLDRVQREGTRGSAGRAFRARISILAGQGRQDLALAVLQEAVGRVPDDPTLRLALGQALAEQEADEDAARVLLPLATAKDSAEMVINVLTPVVARAPSSLEARRVRGLAAMTAVHPGIADADFSAVLEQEPFDAALFYRRGRVRLMSGFSPGDEGWNASFSASRVLDAAFDLARAVTLNPADDESRHGLRWLVDRICTTDTFHGAFSEPSSQGMREIFAAFPGLEQALRAFWPARDLASEQRYGEALERFGPLQRGLLDLDMPVSACRLDAFMADALLELFDLQGALEHLDRARNLVFLIGQPMTRALEAQAVETHRLSIQQSGRPALLVEPELGGVYGMVLEALPMQVELLRLDAMGRVGNFDELLQFLDRQPELETTVRPSLVRAQLKVAARLRDAGHHTRALALIERLEPSVVDLRSRAFLLNLRGTIHLNLQDLAAAEQAFTAALDAARQNGLDQATLTTLNLARVFIQGGRFAEARSLLDSAVEGLPAFTHFEQMLYHWLNAETALGLDEIDMASAEVETALRMAEEMRGDFSDPANRLTWQGRLVSLYDLALYVAVARQDPSLMLDLTERTRARAYLDVLRSGVSALPDSARELADHLESVRARLTVLQQIDQTLRRQGPAFVDIELLRALERVMPEARVTQITPSGREVMSPSQVENAISDAHQAVVYLEDQLDKERARVTAAAVGKTLNTAGIADLLRAASDAATGPAASSQTIVLVEYLQVRGVLCCLVMRSGETVPSIHLIERTSDDLATIAAAAPWRHADHGPWQELLSALVVPAVERSNPEELLWIVPCGPLHHMPLHAARVEGAPLLERNPVSYSSSASAMSESLARSRTTYTSAIVLGDAAEDLPFARTETLSVAARFGVRAMVGPAASEQALMQALDDAQGKVDVLHLATHGAFDENDVLESGIDLAGAGGTTSRLTARDIVRKQLVTELVTLSACETGRTTVFAGDEPVGLTRAFLSAGAAAVLATLWVANDLATRLIVERFYDLLRQPLDPGRAAWRKAEAIRAASLDVRSMTLAELLTHPDANVVAWARTIAAERNLQPDDTPFAATRYWAPFTLVGAWT